LARSVFPTNLLVGEGGVPSARRIAAFILRSVSSTSNWSSPFEPDRVPAMDEYPPFDPTTPTLPEPYLIALGRVTYLWGGLESIVELAIAKFLGFALHEVKAAIIVAHMSWPQRMDVLESMIHLYENEYPHLKAFPDVKAKLKKAQEGRNMLLHSKLVMDNDKVRTLRFSSRGKVRISSDELSVSDIDAVFFDIGNASMELLKLVLNK
jgi:hypothetical protein